MPETFRKIRGHSVYAAGLPSNPIVLDLGANHGDFSIALSKQYPGTYCLYEANPTLAANLNLGSGFYAYNMAITAECHNVSFHIAKNDEASSLLPLQEKSPYNATISETLEIRGVSLDFICNKIDNPIIDLMKIDIEGAEVAALQSCPIRTLRRIGQITVEFHCDPSFGFNLEKETEAVIKKLKKNGFVYLDFSGGNKNNVLFVNRYIHKISAFRELTWQYRLHPPKIALAVWKLTPSFFKSLGRKCFALFGFDGL